VGPAAYFVGVSHEHFTVMNAQYLSVHDFQHTIAGGMTKQTISQQISTFKPTDLIAPKCKKAAPNVTE
jgi:hypothetical protein